LLTTVQLALSASLGRAVMYENVSSTAGSDTMIRIAPMTRAMTIDSTVTVTVFADQRLCRK
jgi:hypothetical protein